MRRDALGDAAFRRWWPECNGLYALMHRKRVALQTSAERVHGATFALSLDQ